MRKQIIILAVLLLPMAPGSSQIPDIIQQTLTLKQDNNKGNDSQKADEVQQAVMEVEGEQSSSVDDPAKTRFERARDTKDTDQLKAMSEMEARRMMRTSDTRTYRGELERYNLVTPQ